MIRVTRAAEGVNMLRSYKIYIDGIYRGKVKNDETKEFEVEHGNHVVVAKIDWGRSNRLIINVSDSTVDIDLGCSMTGWKAWFTWPAYTTFLSHKFLWLRKKDGADSHSPLYECAAGEPQEMQEVTSALERISKQMKWAMIAMSIATGLYALSGILIFLYLGLGGGMFGVRGGAALLLLGLLILGLTIGIRRHNQKCAVIVAVILGVIVIHAIASGFSNWTIGDYIANIALGLGAALSLISSFRYEALVEKHGGTSSSEIAALLEASEPKKKTKS